MIHTDNGYHSRMNLCSSLNCNYHAGIISAYHPGIDWFDRIVMTKQAEMIGIKEWFTGYDNINNEEVELRILPYNQSGINSGEFRAKQIWKQMYTLHKYDMNVMKLKLLLKSQCIYLNRNDQDEVETEEFDLRCDSYNDVDLLFDFEKEIIMSIIMNLNIACCIWSLLFCV